MSDEQRIKRLVGDGKSGGGLPLPDAFGAILELLLDNGTASAEELSKAVSTTPIVEQKKALIFTAHRNWKAFARDLTQQLAAEGFITPVGSDDLFTATEKVIPGESLLYIPGSDVRGVVYSASQRRVLDKLAEVRAEAAAGGLADDDTTNRLLILENSFSGAGPKRKVAHAGSIVPLEYDPRVMRMCTGDCGRDLPQAEGNYTPFKSHGEYYWHRKCDDCRRTYDTEVRAQKTETTRVKKKLETLARHTDGSAASVQMVFREMGQFDTPMDMTDDVLLRRYWDDLALLGKIPYRKVS